MNGPHEGKEYVGVEVAGFCNIVIPDCGCRYQGWAMHGVVCLYFQPRPSTEAIPESFLRAFSGS